MLSVKQRTAVTIGHLEVAIVDLENERVQGSSVDQVAALTGLGVLPASVGFLALQYLGEIHLVPELPVVASRLEKSLLIVVTRVQGVAGPHGRLLGEKVAGESDRLLDLVLALAAAKRLKPQGTGAGQFPLIV